MWRHRVSSRKTEENYGFYRFLNGGLWYNQLVIIAERRNTVGKWKLPWPKSWLKRRRVTENATYSIRDCVVFLVLFLFSSVLCLLLRQLDPNNDTS